MDTQVTVQDEYFLDTLTLRTFIAQVQQAISTHDGVTEALDALQPHFARLLEDPTWLSEEFALPYEKSGMGGGIASWLLFRSGDRSLSLSSLVVPPGSETPVHDHLAWGVVGLYRGEQRETVYLRHDDDPGHEALHTHEGISRAVLTVAEINELTPGDFYRLLPPDGDIHSVKTTSEEPSVSIHLLTNDVGCIIRHSYNPQESTARAFRSGYSNVACADDPA